MLLLFAVFVSGVILWLIATALKPYEVAAREAKLQKRIDEFLVRKEASDRERQARIRAAIREAYRLEGYDVDAADARAAAYEANAQRRG